jgi:mannose-binding lectin 2
MTNWFARDIGFKMASWAMLKLVVFLSYYWTAALLTLANIPDELDDAYFERDYSLLKPYTSHNWDMYGSTVVTPEFVRLTPDRQSKRGSIWNRVPVTMHNWEVSVHFAVHGSGDLLYGDGFALWYTKDRGMDGPVFGSRDHFTGLGIFFDTYSNQNGPHEHDHPFISTMVNNGSVHYDHDRDGTHGQINGCHSKFRARDHDTFVIVSYIDKVLSIYTSVDGDNDWNECFTAADVYLPTGYYFGVSAATGDLADNHDIINIRVFDVDQGENPVSPLHTSFIFWHCSLLVPIHRSGRQLCLTPTVQKPHEVCPQH